ncbi:MAG: zf-HC2 domain-containing protein [Gemmatimonadales bacterium]|nr:zf-HC2 domain-containing protein [Gemmatimonadota bacterium]MCL4214226.1 zf-HC2 domain-containing protein [Gemmatimonadales bacterium]
MIDCEAVMRELWDFLDGELPAERLALIDAHVRLCDRCGPHLRFERAFRAALHRARQADGAPEALGERVRTALATLGYQDPR